MKKFTIILVCMLVCFTLFSGCTDKKGNNDQDTNVGNSVEVDDTDIANTDVDIDTDVEPGTETLPDGFTYEFKDPDNTDGIVVTPKK